MTMVLKLVSAAMAMFVTRAAAAPLDPPPDDRPDIMRLRPGDPEMTEAMRKARARLDDFLSLAANPPSTLSNFSLKVGLPLNEKDVEFVWVRPFKRDGDNFTGRLVNTPRDFPGLSYGQRIGFDRANIIDFAYRDGDVLKGHYTTCVLLKRMPEQQRTDVLAQNPIACAK